MPAATLIRDLTLILSTASLVAVIFKKLKQPLVLGYLLSGVLLGPILNRFFLEKPILSDLSTLQSWGTLGVLFLMFALGLEFSFRRLMRVGLTSLFTALIEVSFIIASGFLLGTFLGFNQKTSLLIGFVLSISSTTIIVKTFEDLKVETKRFAESIYGILIVEDLLAILILVFLSTISASESLSVFFFLKVLFSLGFFIGIWLLLGFFVVPRIIQWIGKERNEELLLLSSLAFCFLLVTLAEGQNYSLALGAFMMGSIIAESSESYLIQEKLTSLKQLFSAVFFVSIGMLFDPIVLMAHYHHVLLFFLALVLFKTFFIFIGATITGQSFRSAIQIGLGMAQIGEFSFILLETAREHKIAPNWFMPVFIAVSTLSTVTTPYFVKWSNSIAVFLEKKILPPKIKLFLQSYLLWVQSKSSDQLRRAQFYKKTTKFLVLAFIVSAVFLLVGQYGKKIIFYVPILSNFESKTLWAIAFLISAPFLHAMSNCFKGFTLEEGRRSAGVVLLFTRVILILFLGVLSLIFFSLKETLLVVVGFVVLFLTVFNKPLLNSYHWIEEQFLKTFEDKPKSKKSVDVFRHLAPWDAHLVRLKIHPNSEVVGKELRDLDLRGKFGINIVVVQRGTQTTVAPHPNFILYPKDELLVLGSDDQVDSIRKNIEKPPGLEDRFKEPFKIGEFDLKQVLVHEKSKLNGKTIRDSGIREDYGAMVVGIERKIETKDDSREERIINPNSQLVLKSGDVLWIVGESQKIQGLG